MHLSEWFPLFAVLFCIFAPVITWSYCTMANRRDERVNPHPYRIQLDSVHHELAEALDRIEGRDNA